jgi:hypothetical protein
MPIKIAYELVSKINRSCMEDIMIYYVYRTTNLINNKYYIGKHASKKFNPRYFGSGKALKLAVQKYGKENFKVKIIKTFDTEDEAFTYERLIVENLLDDPNCYNLVDGGRGFSTRSGKLASDKAKENGWLGFKSLDQSYFKEIQSKACRRGAQVNRLNGTGVFGMTYEQRSVWSTENNRDRQWITNGTVDYRAKKSDLIPDGYYIGRSKLDMSSRNNFLCWTNGEINVFGYECPGEGFRNGMLKTTPTAKLPWWNDGKVNKRSYEQPGPDFVPGRLPWKSKIVTCPHCDKVGGETAMKQHHFDHCKIRTDHV